MKNIRKVPVFVLAVILGIMAISGIGNAGVSYAGDLKWETEDGVWVYEVLDDSGEVCIWDYYGKKTELVIPSVIDGKTVTMIGNYAFSGYSNLTSIEDSASVFSKSRL